MASCLLLNRVYGWLSSEEYGTNVEKVCWIQPVLNQRPVAQRARVDLTYNQGAESYSIIGRTEMCHYWNLFQLFKMVHGIVQLDAATGVAIVTCPCEWTERNSSEFIVKCGYCCDKIGKLVIDELVLVYRV